MRDKAGIVENSDYAAVEFLLANRAGRATTRGLEMQMEDALDFRDGLRQVVGTVRARDDESGA